MVTSFQHYNDVTDRLAVSVETTCGYLFFYLSLGLVQCVRCVKTAEIWAWCARICFCVAFCVSSLHYCGSMWSEIVAFSGHTHVFIL